MHGAALAWSLMMPPGTALLELWPQPNMWRLYEHTAQWAGLHYRRVSENAFMCSMHTLHVYTTVQQFGWGVHDSAMHAIFC